LNERLGEPVETEDVSQAVEGGDRPRYEIREGRIRALYGPRSR
jgi:RNA:NAD 2'-phosphotransferase (TPT1/KptA family)